MMEPEGKPCVDSKRFLKREQARWECAERVSTMVLSQTRGLWLFSVIRGGIELTQRLSAGALVRPTTGLDTLPRTERFENRLGPAPDNLRLASVLITRSSCLLFQFSGIEVGSFLPNR